MCGSVGRKSTWEQITFYVETIKQSTTIKGLENYGLSFSEAMGAEGVHESVHTADPVEVNRDIRSSQVRKIFQNLFMKGRQG